MTNETFDRIQRYYTPEPDKEWRRLDGLDTGPVEFELTTRQIANHLAPHSHVLDIGGGPGRYTIWLAENGHVVTLADLVPALLDFARIQIDEAGVGANVEEIVTSNVCDLSRWPDGSFDAVICLGPFYHLPDPAQRNRAASELARVLRTGGTLLAAFMPRLGFLRRSIAVREEWPHLRDQSFVRSVLKDGAFYNDNPGRFDAGYGAKPEEIAPFFERFGFQTVALLATESFAPIVSEQLAEMKVGDPDAYAAALDILESTAAEPSILGAANHLLYIAKR